MSYRSSNPDQPIEYILSESTPTEQVQTINGLVARHRRDYYLSDIYLYNGKGKIVFTKKTSRIA